MLLFWNQNGGRDALIEGLTNSFHALMAILRPIGEAFRDVFPAMTGERLVAITKAFRDFTKNLQISENTALNLKLAFKGLFSLWSIGYQIVGTLARGLAMLLGISVPVGGGILQLAGSFGGFLINLNESIKASGILNGILEKFKEIVKPIPEMFNGMNILPAIFNNFANAVGYAFKVVTDFTSKIFESFNFEKLFSVINSAFSAGILLGIGKLIFSLKGIADSAGDFLGGITGILDGVADSLQAYQNQLNAGTLLKIAMAIGILAAALTVLSLIDPKSLSSALTGISILFIELFAAMSAFMRVVATAGLKGFISISVLTFGMIGLSTAVMLLSTAMHRLAGVDWDDILKGLVGVGSLTAILVASSKLLSANSALMTRGSIGFIALAASLGILSMAVEKMGNLSLKTLTKGLASIGLMFLELKIFLNSSRMSLGIGGAVSLLLLTAALNGLSGAVNRFGNMGIETLIKGLYSLTYVLIALSTFMEFTSSNDIIRSSIGITILSGALVIFSAVIESMGSMPVNVISKGLITLAAALLILGVAMKFMKASISGAAFLLVLAGALAILTPVIKTLGGMPIKSISKALLTLVAALVILGGATVILRPLIPAMLGLAAAILLIAAGGAAAGAALILIGTGLTAVAAGLTALVSSIVFIFKSLSDLTGYLYNIITSVLQVIIDSTPKFMTAMVVVITAMLDTIIMLIPKLMDAGTQIMVAILTGIAINMPKIVTAAVDALVAFINTIIVNLPRVIQAGFDLVIAFINGVADALRGNTDTLVGAMNNLMVAIGEAGKAALTAFIPSFGQVGVNLVGGLLNGMTSMIGKLAYGAAEMARSALIAAKNALGIASPSKEFEKLGAYADGLIKYGGMSESAANNIGQTVNSALTDSIIRNSGIYAEIEVDPTIRPVLDLTNVNSGLQSAFDQQRGINVSATQNGALSIASTNQNGGNVIDPDSKMGTILSRLSDAIERFAPTEEGSSEPTYEINITNPAPEPASDSLRTQLMRVAYLGGA
jgi:hypothetical protein